jgi:vacuolar-type H+-ATPase subunit B/Vma2
VEILFDYSASSSDKRSMEAIEGGAKLTKRDRITVQVSRQMKRRIARLARARGISPSDVVRMTLSEHLPSEVAA